MGTGQLSDEILAARVAQGDQIAFEALYDRYSSIVLGVALRITGKRTTAEGILQETFWRMWQRADTYQPELGPFITWLLRIARKLAIDAHRLRNVRPKDSSNSTNTDPILDLMPDPEMNVAEQAQSNLMAHRARNALKTLLNKQRQVIELAYFSGMTRQEIAEATGQPLGIIHTQARLGLKKLREALEREKFEV